VAGRPTWLVEIEDDLVGHDRVVEVRALDGGEVNETLQVTCASGSTLVARRAPAHVADWHPTIEGQVAAIERARAVGVPAPEVVYAKGRVLAYRHVAGEAPTGASVTPELAREIGRVHGLLHAVRGDGVGPVQADGTSAGWDARVAFAEVDQWVDRLRERRTVLRQADVEAAAALLRSYDVPPTSRLLHGDASPGNTVVREGRVVGIIDFDDAWYGDPASDASWWWWNAPATGAAFAAGCAETNEPLGEVTIWLYRLRLLLGLADTFAGGTNPRRTEKIGRLLGEALGQARSALD
jgi:aminoglycoside phosphotransferase (APT) family kinase protein